MNLEHPLVTQVNRYGYPLDNLPQVFYCDCCGDPIEGDCFELDGYIYCDADCLIRNTDVNYGSVYECDCCGDEIDGKCFELDGYIYCGIRCLTKSTDVQYGDVYEFKVD